MAVSKISDFFDIRELVCREVYNKHKEGAWAFLDPSLLDNLLYIRQTLNKPIWVNSWMVGGKYSQRGMRCNLCSLVAEKTKAGALYVSAHIHGKAVDFDVAGMTASEVRKWVLAHSSLLPHPCRLEDGVSWVHMDTRNTDEVTRVKLFKA